MSNPIIENVRRSLGRSADNPLSPRPPVLPARLSEAPEVETDRFLEEVRKLSGTAQQLAADGIAEAMKTLVVEYAIRKAAVWQTPFLEQIGAAGTLSSLGVELIPPNADKNALAQCELGVTEADYLLPETGTLVLRSSAEKPRAVSLLPRIHLAVVRTGQMRPDLHQVFAEAKDSPYLVFITGPSRTADIELTTTLGVHGPKTLVVWMITDQKPDE